MNDVTDSPRIDLSAADGDYPRYAATLRVEGGDFYVNDLTVTEAYNGGWKARLSFRVTERGQPVKNVLSAMGTAIAEGIFVGMQASIYIGARADAEDDEGVQVRCFPGFVSAVEPFSSYDERTRTNHTYLEVFVHDVVNHLKGQNVWGAFRAHSAAEIVGGMLAIAGGNDGRATLEPVIPGHSPITVHNALREDLDFIPYAIASGQTLGQWLDEFYSRLGIRMEMLSDVANCDLHIMLHDKAPRDTTFKMRLGGAEAGPDGNAQVVTIGSYRGARARAALLDDPTKGAFRRLEHGPVGHVVSGEHISLEEAQMRAGFNARGRGAEMLMSTIRTAQPALRPGRTVLLNKPLIEAISWTRYWQVSTITHNIRGFRYENVADVMRGDVSWHPPRPAKRPPVIVPGRVDAGPSYENGAEVPRDRLGRIPVGFPFTPMPFEASATQGFDLTGDQRITKDDFEHILKNPDGGETANKGYWEHMDAEEMKAALQKAAGEDSWLSGEAKQEAMDLADTEAREADIEKLNRGVLDDPFPGRTDDDLSDDELDERTERESQRTRAFRYMAWKRALAYEESGGDYDHDGYTTVVDGRMSEELKAEFDSPAKLEHLRQEAKERASESEDGYTPPSVGGDVVDEYLRLFGEGAEDTEIYRVAQLQKDAADEQWPPRLPLPVLQPMAGGEHGFVSGHRQGDACRVVVHDAMRAEIVGFQYRSDRDLGASMGGSVSGIVVEHNRGASWSGMVFRKTANPQEQDQEQD